MVTEDNRRTQHFQPASLSKKPEEDKCCKKGPAGCLKCQPQPQCLEQPMKGAHSKCHSPL
jgi:hypothetical protein